MLSRVIASGDTSGIDLRVFAPAPLSSASAGPPGWVGDACEEPLKTQELAAECARLTADNRLLQSNLSDLERQSATAQKTAFEAGCRQGEQRAQSEMTPVVEKMKQAIADTVGARDEARRHAERDVVQLALLIARRVLHREIATDPSSLAALAKVVFERMARADSYTVTIHPMFLAAVQSTLSGNQIAKVKIEPDPSSAPGTFIVRSAEGTIDASIDTQLEEISRGLADRLAQD